MNIQIQGMRPNLLIFRFEKISRLAFIKIITEFNIFSYKTQKLSENYIDAALEQDELYKSLLPELEKLEAITKKEHFQTLGQLLDAEIAISEFAFSGFIKKLSTNSLPELNRLAENICLQRGVSCPARQNDTIKNCQVSETPRQQEIKLLDVDRSFENKILFYYLRASSTENTEKVLERVELLTMEQKEIMFQNIFSAGISTCLPKIILEHQFCSLQLSDTLHNFQALMLCPQTRLFFEPFSTKHGYLMPESIIPAGQQELFLTTMEKIKKYFLETGNQYIIPQIFRQNALVSLNLLQSFIIKRQQAQSVLINQLLNQIYQELPFLKTLN